MGRGGFQRIQCKTGRLKGEIIAFATASYDSRSYHGDADLFGVYVPALDKVYLVPVDECPSRLAHLRLAPTKSNQKIGIRLANQYELR
jgi:hypothetical protein